MTGIAYYNSPVGDVAIRSDDDAITHVSFLHGLKGNEVMTPVIRQCMNELDSYFHAGREHFSVKLNPKGTDFQLKVWMELLKIPFGETSSYTTLSIAVGNIKSIRAVGLANGQNPIAILIPCHRVIGKDGSLVGYAGGLDKKQWLLKHEGVLSNQMQLFG